MANQIGLLAKVSFVNKISVLMKATSDDREPTPGYLYSEVTNITLESEDHCENCLDFLVKRLEEESAHVKFKVLKIMTHIVTNGHPNFKLGLLKKSRGIQEATKFSGPPDSLCGMDFYVQTRQVAQSLLEVLFNIDKETLESPSSDQIRVSPIATTGIGSNTFQSPSDRPRMEGFGNITSTPQKTLGDNIKDSFLKIVDKMAEPAIDHKMELLATLDGSTSYRAPREATLDYPVSDPPDVVATSVKSPKQVLSPPKHVPGRAGGGWEDSDEEEQEWLVPQSGSTGSSTHAALTDRLENASLEDYTAEMTVVSSYVDNIEGQLLTRAQLKAFLKECAGLNCDKIVEFINSRISSSATDSSLMKCLLLVETLMTSDLVNLERLTSVYKDNLVSVYHSKTGPPKSKARKLIRILEKLTSHSNILPLDGSTTGQLVDPNT